MSDTTAKLSKKLRYFDKNYNFVYEERNEILFMVTFLKNQETFSSV